MSYARAGMYQNGSRFSLGDWSTDIATLFTAVEPGVAQLVGTVSGQPVATVPIPVQTVNTPIGTVPSYMVFAALIGAAILFSRRR